ncbi:MAG: helix-turn-helix domain-containing protein [Clostridiales Family XIII bacterium]|jgi:DNA-binding XRE family transcriptional regulator|nr:helix-turn-helix domain-containing protein [Clostridiales Family XIII bacterium]
MKNKHVGGTFQDFEAGMLEQGLITQEELDASKARVAIMCELIDARNAGKISQRKLEELAGVRQATISDMEAGKTSPSIDTLLKVLAPLGKTLIVAPIEGR